MKSYESPVPILPLCESKHAKAIDGEQLTKMLDGHYSAHFKQVVVVDCRWPYEYEGGHIRGAMSLYTKEAVLEQFLPSNLPHYDQRTAIVFHCEFSQHRGPSRFKELRNADRQQNLERHPEMFYPFLFLLEGGYRKFHASHKEYCIGGYRPMDKKEHRADLRKCNKLYRARRKSSKSLLSMLPNGAGDMVPGRRRLAQSDGGMLQDENDMVGSPPSATELVAHRSYPTLDFQAMCRQAEESAHEERCAFDALRSHGGASTSPSGLGPVRPFSSRMRSNAVTEAPIVGQPLNKEETPHGQPAYAFAHADVDVGVDVDDEPPLAVSELHFSPPPKSSCKSAKPLPCTFDLLDLDEIGDAMGGGGAEKRRRASKERKAGARDLKPLRASENGPGRSRSESHSAAWSRHSRWDMHDDEGF
eukprot:TRINITY_DN596_c0_g1_i5.p2 TRINITY_DN596_c0_g1~~TRINITY_DN596_c0_g1_i5.p2  ORF type:complete len:416 (-),score=160.99 TRINITY_DN596_c0_g1_i5:174-1421(-)